MKALFSLFASGVIVLGLGACERHPWEDEVDPETGEVIRKGTKRLFKEEHHGDHSSDDHGTDHKSDAAAH